MSISAMQQSEASVLVTSELSIEPGRTDTFLKWIDEGFLDSRTFDGNLQFDVFVDDAEPGKIVFVERWRSEQDQHNYTEWRTRRGDFEKMQSFLIAPPVTHKFS